jgi:Trk K+ transport system NAD-binding subunit
MQDLADFIADWLEEKGLDETVNPEEYVDELLDAVLEAGYGEDIEAPEGEPEEVTEETVEEKPESGSAIAKIIDQLRF